MDDRAVKFFIFKAKPHKQKQKQRPPKNKCQIKYYTTTHIAAPRRRTTGRGAGRSTSRADSPSITNEHTDAGDAVDGLGALHDVFMEDELPGSADDSGADGRGAAAGAQHTHGSSGAKSPAQSGDC